MNDNFVKKVTIYGAFFDSYIYKDKLLLIHLNKDVDSLFWDKLIGSHTENSNDKLAYECAFRNSKFFYNPYYSSFYNDAEFYNLIIDKIQRIKNIEIKQDSLIYKNCLVNSKNKPIEYLPNDIIVYKNMIYFSNSDGIYYKKISSLGGYRSKYSISPTSYYLTDKQAVSLGILNGGYLYLATLDDGLWVYNLRANEFLGFDDDLNLKYREPKKLLPEHASFIKNNYSSIMVGSYLSDSYFIENYYVQKKRKTKKPMKLNDIFCSDDEAFYTSGQDKIYRITKTGIYLITFTQSRVEKDKEFSDVELILEKDFGLNEIVSASVELFGIVIEYKTKLEIILSDNSFISFDTNHGLVNWRTFPRSQNYTNQIHLIYEDRIEIISINHDFLINQQEKKFGVRYTGLDYLREKIDD